MTQFPESPPADLLAAEIAEDYRSYLGWDRKNGSWLVSDESGQAFIPIARGDYWIETFIYWQVKKRGVKGYGSFSYITDIISCLRCELAFPSPEADEPPFSVWR